MLTLRKINALALLFVYLCASANAGPVEHGMYKGGNHPIEVPPMNSDGMMNGMYPGPVVPKPENPVQPSPGSSVVQVDVIAKVLADVDVNLKAIVALIAKINVDVELKACVQIIADIQVKIKAIIDLWSGSCNKMQPKDAQSVLVRLNATIQICIDALVKIQGLKIDIAVYVNVLLKLLLNIQLYIKLCLGVIAKVNADIQVNVRALLNLYIKLSLNIFADVLAKVFIAIDLLVKVALNLNVELDVAVKAMIKLMANIKVSINLLNKIFLKIFVQIGGVNPSCNNAVKQTNSAIMVYVDLIVGLFGNGGKSTSGLDGLLNNVLVSLQALVKANVQIQAIVKVVLSLLLEILVGSGNCYEDAAGSQSGLLNLNIDITVDLMAKISLIVSAAVKLGVSALVDL